MTSQKDEIANYLFQSFIEGNNNCEKPSQLVLNSSWDRFIPRLSRLYLEQIDPPLQKAAVHDSVFYLLGLLGCSAPNAATLDALSSKLSEVYSREVHSLRPLLDILDAERAWQQEYQGTRHKTLLQNIQASFRLETVYGNSGAIIQSSGYGKSRTVNEMAALIPTIPMNIRAVREETQGAFPPADATLINIFGDMIKLEDPVQSLFLFFKQLFDVVRDLAKDFRRDTFAADLHWHLKDHGRRAKLYTDLRENLKQNSSSEVDGAEVARSFEKLAELFPESKATVKLIIYIDEAHTLASMISQASNEGTSMYTHMLKATADFSLRRNLPVFFLFLSTTSRLETLVSQDTLSSSARFQMAGESLVAPFTEMPFDCHPSLLEEAIQPGLMLEAIQKFSFAVRFGRPLFWAYFEAMIAGVKAVDKARAHTSTIQIAQAKLMGETTLSTLGNTGKLAILDTLLNLDYDPQKTHSYRLASSMVASHLRTVYSVPISRAYMDTGYPSEPILAEAALRCANEIADGDTLGLLLPLFRDLDENTAGVIHKGKRGENVGKMILLLAYTAAVKKNINPNVGAQFWGHGCSLVAFLEELTGERFTKTVLESKPDNLPGGVTLEEAFQNSWVRFTHFARAADDSAMTSSMAWVAFTRGMAMIGWHSQQVVDVCIPVLLDKNKPISEANMTAILVQLKVHESRTNASVDEATIKFFPPPGSSRDAYPTMPLGDKEAYLSRPYISLVMELGLVVTPDGASIPSKVVDILDKSGGHKLAPTSQSKNKTNLSVSNVHITLPSTRHSQRNSRQKHPRYSLFYYGCSHKVYRCIPNTDEAHNVLKALLLIPNVFTDRPLNRPIDPVLQMKPFWNAGSNCFSWVAEPYFNPTKQQAEQENDEVLIGIESIDVDMGYHSTTGDAMDEDP